MAITTATVLAICNVHIVGNTTSGVPSTSAATRAGIEASFASLSSNSVPPWPTNKRTVRVRRGNTMLQSTSFRKLATFASKDAVRPSCSSTPLPNASTCTWMSWVPTSKRMRFCCVDAGISPELLSCTAARRRRFVGASGCAWLSTVDSSALESDSATDFVESLQLSPRGCGACLFSDIGRRNR